MYPAHGAGSLCGKALSKETVSTIGEQRRLNYALQPMTKAAFVEMVTADQPDAPPYFTYDAVLNSQERPTLDETLARELNPLSLDQVLALQAGRRADARHARRGRVRRRALTGSVNVGLGGQYATWAGTILSREQPIVIVADPGHENEAAIRLGRIGFDHIAGYLADGLHSLESRAGSDRRDRAPQPGARRRRAWRRRTPPLAVDVRTPRERAAEAHRRQPPHAAQPSGRAAAASCRRARPLLVYCAGGYRSSIAASVLQHHGFDRASARSPAG